MPLVCGSVPSECSFSPRHVSGDDEQRPEHWVATGTMTPRVLHPGGAGSAPGRAASGLRRRRSLCWGSEHGGCGRAGGALLRWDPPRWDRGDSSVCPSLHPPPLVTASSFSKSVSVSSVSPSGSDVSDTRRCLSSSV